MYAIGFSAVSPRFSTQNRPVRFSAQPVAESLDKLPRQPGRLDNLHFALIAGFSALAFAAIAQWALPSRTSQPCAGSLPPASAAASACTQPVPRK